MERDSGGERRVNGLGGEGRGRGRRRKGERKVVR